jgi:hypothetical protein
MPVGGAAHRSVGLIRTRREARLAAGLYGCLADLLGPLGSCLAHLSGRLPDTGANPSFSPASVTAPPGPDLTAVWLNPPNP